MTLSIIPETYFSLSEHMSLFLWSIAWGVVFGIVYDVFRTIRILLPHNNTLVFIEDILFMMLYSIFIICYSSSMARGEFRIVYPIGNFLGFSIYILTIGNVIINIIKKIIKLLKSILTFILKPFYLLFLSIWKKSSKKFVGIYKLFVSLLKNSVLLLIDMLRMLYNNKVNTQRKSVNKVGKKKQTKKRA